MTPRELLEEMNYWGPRYGKKYGPNDAHSWYPLFQNVDMFDLREAAIRHSMRSQFAPKPADLLPLIKNIEDERRGPTIFNPAKSKKEYLEFIEKETRLKEAMLKMNNLYLKSPTNEEKRDIWKEKRKIDQAHASLWLQACKDGII